MIQKYCRIMVAVITCLMLASCGGERRVDGEMPFDSDALITMAESFLQAGDYNGAIRLYQRAANENSQNIPSRLGLGKTYQALGSTEAAITFYEQVLVLDPNNVEAKLGVGQMLIAKNRPSDAIPYLKDLLKQEPKNYRIYNMLGLAHDLLGKQEEAQMNYGQGLALEPDNISLLNNLALSFAFEEQYAPAIKLLSKAVNLDNSVTKARQNLVLVYVLSGEEDAGRKIGESLMTAEEMDRDIQFYKWVKTLPAMKRAQAVFLGIKTFPEENKIAPAIKAEGGEGVSPENLPVDAKKRELREILNEEQNLVDQRNPDILIKHDPETVTAMDRQETEENKSEMAKHLSPLEYVYRVQIGSFLNTRLANKGWNAAQRHSKGLLDAYEPLVKLVTLANGKTHFRLFVAEIEDRALAKTLCDDLRDQNVDCLVLKTLRD